MAETTRAGLSASLTPATSRARPDAGPRAAAAAVVGKAGWPGGANLLLGSLANGLVVGLLLAAVALVVSRGR